MVLQSDNILSLKIFYDELKKHTSLRIYESFDYPSKCIANNVDGEKYNTEICIPLLNCQNDYINQIDYHAKELVKGNVQSKQNNKDKRYFFLGDEWLFYKIYGSHKMIENILSQKIPTLINRLRRKKLIEKWFFIRYSDPSFHLRLRFKVLQISQITEIINTLNCIFRPFLESKAIIKIETDTYIRELERYGIKTIDFSENIFHHDSNFIIKILKRNELKSNKWLISILNIDSILNDFEIDLDQRIEILNELKSAFLFEHGNENKLIHSLKSNYRKNYLKIKDVLEGNFEESIELKCVVKLLIQRSIYYKKFWKETLKSTKITEAKKKNLIFSYIHMSTNRLFSTNARTHELLAYDHLYIYYKSKSTFQKR